MPVGVVGVWKRLRYGRDRLSGNRHSDSTRRVADKGPPHDQ